jgi:hypothetical protein
VLLTLSNKNDLVSRSFPTGGRSGEPVRGEVVEVLTALSEPDVRVRVRYPNPPGGGGRPVQMLEHLYQMDWELC